MPVKYLNYEYKTLSQKGKRIFVPTEDCRKIGGHILKEIKDRHAFPSIFCHMHRGGHIKALHVHIGSSFFLQFDIKNFFYSISRDRVFRAMRALGIPDSDNLSRWSTVRNPDTGPKYCLPYGFVQSPALATIALERSPLGFFLASTEVSGYCRVSIFMDDVIISSSSEIKLTAAANELPSILKKSSFEVKDGLNLSVKTHVNPFNCTLSSGKSAVLADRVAEFYKSSPSADGIRAFAAYVSKVESRDYA